MRIGRVRGRLNRTGPLRVAVVAMHPRHQDNPPLMARTISAFHAISMSDSKDCTADLPVTLVNLTAPGAARAMRSPVICGPPGAAQSLRLPGSYPDRHASPRTSFWPPDSHRCGPLLPLLPAWHWGLGTVQKG